jgi:hypothetical protein
MLGFAQSAPAQDAIPVPLPAPEESTPAPYAAVPASKEPLTVDITNQPLPNDDYTDPVLYEDPTRQEVLDSLAQSEVFPENEIYEDPNQETIYDNYIYQETSYSDDENTNIVEQNEVIVIPSDSQYLHPLLSLDFSDSLFSKLSEMEKEKSLLDMETKQRQTELELSKLKRDQLKLDSEIKKLEDAEANQTATQDEMTNSAPTYATPVVHNEDSTQTFEITSQYEIKNISGIGGVLTATLNNLKQNKILKVREGTTVGDGLIVRSISPVDGILFEKGKDQYPLKIKQN